MTMQSIWKVMTEQMSLGHWLTQVVLVIVIAGLINFAINQTVRRLARGFKSRRQYWNRIIVNSINKPARGLVWIIGISYAVELIKIEAKSVAIFQLVDPFRTMGVILMLTWFAMRFIHHGQTYYLKNTKAKKLDVTTVHAVGKLLRITILIISALVILQSLDFKISGILAFGGIGGIAVGFAAKDLLANFFGGFVLYFDRPFKVGDWIYSPDKQIEGTVEEISWRITRIRTFDKRPLYVPNSAFLSIIVINASRMWNRRIKATISLRYDDWKAIDPIVHDVENMLKSHPEIDTSLTCFIKLVNFGSSSLDLLLYTFTKTTDWVTFQSVQQDVFLKIMKIIENHGAECAFPTTTLHVPEGIDMKTMEEEKFAV